MLRRSAIFLFRGQFLARASLFDLAVGTMIFYSLQRVFDRLLRDIVLPIIGSLVGGLDFSDSFVELSRGITATNLADAKKQGVILAYGDFLTTLIEFAVVLGVLSLVLQSMNAATNGSGLEPDNNQPPL